MTRTFDECLALFDPSFEHRSAYALVVRCRLECMTPEQIEQRIARWERLQDLANNDPCVHAAVRLADMRLPSPAELAGNRCGKGAPGPIPFEEWKASFDRLTPDQQARVRAGECGVYQGPAEAQECGCGGPAGHVPNGVLCRKGWR